jgi:hypothetical protein
VEQIQNILPPKYAAYGAVAVVATQIIGRVYNTLRNGGGLISIWRAVLYGVDHPSPPKQ